MTNLLLNYMKDRFDEAVKTPKEPGPVITISREFGCPSGLIAQKVAEILNQSDEVKKNKQTWRCIGREIIEQSARELHTQPEKINNFFNEAQKSIIDEIIHTLLEDGYKNDIVFKSRIKEVINSFTLHGNIIIIGRGGVALTQDIKRTLHIKLTAPLHWRVENFCKENNLSNEESLKKAIEADKKRLAMIDYFLGRKADSGLFDLYINCERLSVDQVVNIIVSALSEKTSGWNTR